MKGYSGTRFRTFWTARILVRGFQHYERRTVWYTVPNISEEHTASIFVVTAKPLENINISQYEIHSSSANNVLEQETLRS